MFVYRHSTSEHSSWLVQHFYPFNFFFSSLQNKLKIKFSSSDAFAKCTSAFTGTGRESNREKKVWMVSAIVWRIPLHGTVGRTFQSSMTWFITGSVVRNEGKIYPVVILVKLAISINVQENLDLFLWMTPDISLGKHGVQQRWL